MTNPDNYKIVRPLFFFFFPDLKMPGQIASERLSECGSSLPLPLGLALASRRGSRGRRSSPEKLDRSRAAEFKGTGISAFMVCPDARGMHPLTLTK